MRQIVIALALTAGLTTAESFRIAPGPQSRVELEVSKTGLFSGKRHIFTFSRYSGRIDGNAVEFKIEAKSIECHDDWSPASGAKAKIVAAALDEALFASKHPTIEFRSTSVRSVGPDELDVMGDLTIRGVTKPSTIRVKRAGSLYEGSAIVRHSDYSIKQQTAALGAIGTKNEMVVRFKLLAQPGD